MNAVILVGGLGTRLRPLTVHTPKPLIPLVNQPFIERMIENLRDQGIDEVILAVQYLAERFRAVLGDGTRLGVRLHIIEEPEPRGTAGAVKHVAAMLDGTTFVFNGDVLTDLDLQAMLQAHRARQSQISIALTPVDDPTAFGLVETDAEQRIRRFVEKPRPEQITTNMINAGTYIIEPAVLELVPAGRHHMFERGLFPDALAAGIPMYGYPSDAYWTDIGKPQTYLDVHRDILLGRVRHGFRATRLRDDVWLEGAATIDPTVQFDGPVLLGAGVTLEAGVRIVGPSVIGAGCHIGAGSTIVHSVLWARNLLGTDCVISESVVGAGNTIGSRVVIGAGALIGDDCRIGAGNQLMHGVRLWPSAHISDDAITF